MSDLGKIIITKNKDCDNKTYYSAHIYGIDAVIGSGDTRNEAKDELFGNIVFYVNYLIETNQKFKQQLDEKDEQINNLEQMCQICNKEQENELLKQQLAEKDKKIELLNAMISTLPAHDKEIKEYELEKVKDFILENTMLETETAAVLTYIYQQIKELKGQHND